MLVGSESPNLKPYPDWEFNNVTGHTPDSNETKIVNVFRIRVDNCDRLWVVDCGLDDIIGDTKVLSTPKILVFDLNTDKLLRSYKINKSDIKENSFFANIVVDADKGKCDESFAYMPDLGSYGLLVYDWAKDEAWRVEHHYFHFDPVWGDYNIAGVNFQWTDGIFGVSLKKNENDEHKTLYFHPLSSIREFGVSTEILKNKESALSPANYHRFRYVGSRSDLSQSTSSAMDPKTGIMFYTLINKNAVGCWNSKKHPEYSPESNGIVESNNVTMVFPNDLILDKSDNLWVLTDRLPVFLYRSLDTNDTNFRIMMSPVKEAVAGTVCDIQETRSVDMTRVTTEASTSIDVATSTSVHQSTADSSAQTVTGQSDETKVSETTTVINQTPSSSTTTQSTTTQSTTTQSTTTTTTQTTKSS